MRKRSTIRLAAVISAVMLAAMLTGCGKEEAVDTAATASETAAVQTEETAQAETAAAAEPAAPADIVNEILAKVEMSSMAEVASDRIGNYLTVDMATVESFSMYICGSGGFADETAVFAMNSEADTEAVVEAIQKRIDSRSVDFESYNPDEYDKLQNAVVKTEGRYVFFVVSGDNDTAEGIFDSMCGK